MRNLIIVLLSLIPLCGWAAEFHYYVDSSVAAGGDGSIGSPYNHPSSVPMTKLKTWTSGGTNCYIDLAGWFEPTNGGRLIDMGTYASTITTNPITVRAWRSTNAVIACGYRLTNWVATNTGLGQTFVCTNINTGANTNPTYLYVNRTGSDHDYVALPNNATNHTALDRMQWVWTNGMVWLRCDYGNPDAIGYGIFLPTSYPLCNGLYLVGGNVAVTNVTFLFHPTYSNYRNLRVPTTNEWFSGCVFAADAAIYGGNGSGWFDRCKFLCSSVVDYYLPAGYTLNFMSCLFDGVRSFTPGTNTRVLNCTAVSTANAQQFIGSGVNLTITNSIFVGNGLLSTLAGGSLRGNGTNSSVAANSVLSLTLSGLPTTNMLVTNCTWGNPGFVNWPHRGYMGTSDDDSANYHTSTNRAPLAREFGLTHYSMLNMNYYFPTSSAGDMKSQIALGGWDVCNHSANHTVFDWVTNCLAVWSSETTPTMTVSTNGVALMSSPAVSNWLSFSTFVDLNSLCAGISNISGWKASNGFPCGVSAAANSLLYGTSNIVAASPAPWWGFDRVRFWSNEFLIPCLQLSNYVGHTCSNWVQNGSVCGASRTVTYDMTAYVLTNGGSWISAYGVVNTNLNHWPLQPPDIGGHVPYLSRPELNDFSQNWIWTGSGGTFTTTPFYSNNITLNSTQIPGGNTIFNYDSPVMQVANAYVAVFTNSAFMGLPNQSVAGPQSEDWSFNDGVIYAVIYPDNLSSNQCLFETGVSANNYIRAYLMQNGALRLEAAADGITNSLTTATNVVQARAWAKVSFRTTPYTTDIRTNWWGKVGVGPVLRTRFATGQTLWGTCTNWTSGRTNYFTGCAIVMGSKTKMYAWGASLAAYCAVNGSVMISGGHGEGSVQTPLYVNYMDGIASVKNSGGFSASSLDAAAQWVRSRSTPLSLAPEQCLDWNELVGGFTLRSDSPAANIGTPISGITNLFSLDGVRMTDENGNPVKIGWSAGAYQNYAPYPGNIVNLIITNTQLLTLKLTNAAVVTINLNTNL